MIHKADLFHLRVNIPSSPREKKETVRLVDSCEPETPYVETKQCEKERGMRIWQKQYRISWICNSKWIHCFFFSLFSFTLDWGPEQTNQLQVHVKKNPHYHTDLMKLYHDKYDKSKFEQGIQEGLNSLKIYISTLQYKSGSNFQHNVSKKANIWKCGHKSDITEIWITTSALHRKFASISATLLKCK